jgi:hypothetical protein
MLYKFEFIFKNNYNYNYKIIINIIYLIGKLIPHIVNIVTLF